MQALADDNGLDVLHIKGPALDSSISGVTSGANGEPVWGKDARPISSDADVLVRPAHVRALLAAMEQHGWRMLYGFNDGSPFAHASTWEHPSFGFVDLHRSFPGIGVPPDRGFEELWRSRDHLFVAGQECTVPAVVAQRLLLLLHGARAGGNWRGDLRRTWGAADAATRAEIDELAVALHATVPLAFVTGRRETVEGQREYDLWSGLAQGSMLPGRSWVARVRAAPTPLAAVKVGARLLVPSRRRLGLALGRPPTALEVVRAYGDRARLAASEAVRVLRRRRDEGR